LKVLVFLEKRIGGGRRKTAMRLWPKIPVGGGFGREARLLESAGGRVVGGENSTETYT